MKDNCFKFYLGISPGGSYFYQERIQADIRNGKIWNVLESEYGLSSKDCRVRVNSYYNYNGVHVFLINFSEIQFHRCRNLAKIYQ